MPVASYTTCSSGAPLLEPSKASAVRWPLPVTSSTSARPDCQPGRFTTCWISGARPVARCSGPAAPTVGQGSGVQLAEAAVVARPATLFAVALKAGASSDACARIVSAAAAASRFASSTWNCSHASTIGTPRGIASPAKRMPTVCAEPSVTSSRSLLVRLTLVEPTFCSASSALAATRDSTTAVTAPAPFATAPASRIGRENQQLPRSISVQHNRGATLGLLRREVNWNFRTGE